MSTYEAAVKDLQTGELVLMVFRAESDLEAETKAKRFILSDQWTDKASLEIMRLTSRRKKVLISCS